MNLSINDIRLAFGGFQALSGISLSVPAGGLVGLIGPNGAGKSTLFSVISGFLSPDGGAVRFDEADLAPLSPSARARRGLLRTFQVPKEFGHLTVRDNLKAAARGQVGESLIGLFFRPGEVRRQERLIDEKADEVIRFLKLEPVANRPAGGLSGGQKKLLELGRVLMVEPTMVLLDEPFAGVNPVLIEEIVERVRELNARGIGFLIIEHDLGALTRLVPVLHVMDRGTLLASGPPDEVLSNGAVREAYLGGAA
jgi:branched-chain amino acid transport system ATP-binding protein